MKNYQRKPITIQAVQYTVDNLNDVISFMGQQNCMYVSCDEALFLITKKRKLVAIPDSSYVLRGPLGEFTVCTKENFESTYNEI